MKTHYYIFIFILSGFFAFSQQSGKSKLIEIQHAGVLRYDKGINAKRLIGDVICAHEGAVMRCDSAYLYDDKKLEAFGKISIVKGDSIFVYGDKLFYDASTKMATLDGNVKCTERDMSLTTPILTFDVKNSIANYYNGGTIVNKENTLISKNGHYYSSSKELAFKYDVELKNPDYTMRCDTLRYNTISKIAYFLGPSIIIAKDDYIYCENGWYDTEKETSQFSKNAVLVTKEQKLTGDSLLYDRTKGIGKAFKNIRLIDTTNKSVIYGGYAEFYEKDSRAIVTKNPLYARAMDGDTLFLAADTLFHRDFDSTNKLLKAYHHVRFYKKDLQGFCDSLVYSGSDSLMKLFYTPVVWAQQSQITAKQIDITVGKSGLHRFALETNAFLIQEADSLGKFNQIAGKFIEGFFKEDTISKINIKGNAQVLFYPKNKEKIIALNKTVCSDIIAWFKQGDIDKISFKTKPESLITPIKDVNTDEAKLKGFVWKIEQQPKSRYDLFLTDKKKSN